MGFDGIVDLNDGGVFPLAPTKQNANLMNGKTSSADNALRIAELEKRVNQLEAALKISNSGDVCLHGASVTITAQQNIHLKPVKRVLIERLTCRLIEYVGSRRVKLFK